MRLFFVLAVVAAFKLTVSMPAVSDDGECPIDCTWTACCPGYVCQAIVAVTFPVSMSSFHLTPWLTSVVGLYVILSAELHESCVSAFALVQCG
ncbi:hypothetical protein EV702DRAFT_1091371 [Suillus placidus]|uniref:Uncharacterized protein n=1 Tax=Suillus placidus TaxID=48579 RepID=A0A9P6ZZJ0_9AGAM|nr:hypothetical protein EV702DRAFT_1091371 [Suillus placidus]